MNQVASFIRSSASWYEKFVDPKDMVEHYVDQSWINKNYFKRDFFIGYSNAKPVGTISMQNLGQYTYLGYIYLDADQVGKGFGHRLMRYAEKKSREKGSKGMVLIAHPQAKWATKAYIKYGFEKIATEKKDVLAWNNGALKDYYEEGFELYHFKL